VPYIAVRNAPSFSVVIAVYNQRRRVLHAIESVHRQTYTAHEILVVDDGSTDGTADAVRRHFPRVNVLTQENRGKGIARNRGAFLSRGEWICFLDHDDLWHPEKLQCVAECVGDYPEAIAVDHPVWIFRETADGPRKAWGLEVDFTASTLDEALDAINRLEQPRNDFSYLERSTDSYQASLRRVFSTTSALAIRRDAFFIAGGFPPAQANGEDWALSTNVARLGPWRTLTRALSCQRVLPDSGTEDPGAGLMVLSSLAAHWYGGRPLEGPTSGLEFEPELDLCSSSYVDVTQAVLWDALQRRRFRIAVRALRYARLLLPRWRVRMGALAPPPITWRVDRLRRRRRARRSEPVSEASNRRW
jgi:GT2 family glycosyltransferase